MSDAAVPAAQAQPRSVRHLTRQNPILAHHGDPSGDNLPLKASSLHRKCSVRTVYCLGSPPPAGLLYLAASFSIRFPKQDPEQNPEPRLYGDCSHRHLQHCRRLGTLGNSTFCRNVLLRIMGPETQDVESSRVR